MDFKNLVMHDTDSKYQDMANGSTPAPFTRSTKISDYSAYNEKRNKYFRRLNKEKTDFNNAVVQIQKRRADRLACEKALREAKRRDRRKSVFCYNVLFLTVLIIAAILHFAIPNGASAWFEEMILPETGFDTFFAIFDDFDRNNTGFEIGVLSAGIGCLIFLGLLIFAIVKRIKDSELGWLIGVLIGGLFFSGITLILPCLLVRLLFVLLGYVIYYALTPYGIVGIGAIALIMLLVRNASFELKRFKVAGVFIMILLIAATAGGWYFSDMHHEEANDYYDMHNGSTAEKAFEAKEGLFLVNIWENDDERSDYYYLVFTPDESGTYMVSSKTERGASVNLYLNNERISGRDIEQEKGFATEYNLTEDQTYYIRAGFIENEYSGHFWIKIERIEVSEIE